MTTHTAITIWSVPKSDWLFSLQPKMEKLYTISINKTGSWLWIRSWTPYCQIQTEIEESGETTRPFRYDLNQIPYDSTVEVRNRFKGLDLIDRVPDELWMEGSWYCTGDRDQDHPQEKEMQKRQNACLRRPYIKPKKEEKWKAKEKRKDISIWMQNSKELTWLMIKKMQKQRKSSWARKARILDCRLPWWLSGYDSALPM